MFILLLLLSAVHCKIHIHILPETKNQNASVTAFGSESAPITDLEQDTFMLTPSEIKCKLSRAGITPPDIVHVQKTSYYGYRDIYTKLRPSAAKIIGMKKKPVVMFYKELINNSSVPVTFKLGIKEEILERMSVRWSANNDLSIGRELEVNFSQRMQHMTVWDREEKEIRVRTMSTSSDVELTLQPGQIATVTMKAIRARIDVSVEYVALLTGDIYCQYTFFFIPISGRVFDVNEYFNLAQWSGIVSGVQYIYIYYHYGGQVVVEDGESGLLMMKPIELD